LKLVLKNVGHGCASNILVSQLNVPNEYLKQSLKYPSAELHFSKTTYLASGEKAELSFRLISQGQVLPEGPLKEFLSPYYPGPEASLSVSFSDIEGKHYGIKVTINAEQDETKLPRTVTIGPIEQRSHASANG
jgi:hypothetical protein